MRVHSHDRYLDVGEFDPLTGELVESVRDPAGYADGPSGHYARLAGTLVVLYRDRDDLWLRIGNTAQSLDQERASVVCERTGSASRLSLSVDGRELATVEYPAGEGGGPDDPTPFAEPKDFDFGLFVKNVLHDERRRRGIYGGPGADATMRQAGMDPPEPMISPSEFEQMVEASVGRLLTAEGFCHGEDSAFRIRYERGALFVEVEYEPTRSRELTIWFGDADRTGEPPLTLNDVLRATDCDVALSSDFARSQTGDVALLERLLHDARDVLARFGGPLLRGDEAAFARARGIRSEQARAYTAELRNRPVLEAADTAWRAKDYGRVHDLLNPIRDSLDETQKRRLDFAERRLR